MLKISVIDRRTERWLVLEGKLIAPWVTELRSAWQAANGQVGGPALVVDLRERHRHQPRGKMLVGIDG